MHRDSTEASPAGMVVAAENESVGMHAATRDESAAGAAATAPGAVGASPPPILAAAALPLASASTPVAATPASATAASASAPPPSIHDYSCPVCIDAGVPKALCIHADGAAATETDDADHPAPTVAPPPPCIHDYTCPICIELLLRPVKLSCGHRMPTEGSNPGLAEPRRQVCYSHV